MEESIPITARTRYCAVYGHPIQHSASPALQNAGIRILGLDWRYLAFDVDPEHLRSAIAGAQAMKFIGLNLTVPHKLLAMEMVDELDVSAQHWGAVNTIRFEGKTPEGDWQSLSLLAPEKISGIRSRGFNTDANALARSLREDLGLSLERASVVLLGAGGAGRVAALKLASEGVGHIHLVNRTMKKAEELAQEIAARFPLAKINLGFPADSVDLVLNATSVGLKTLDPLPYERESFNLRQARFAYDMIYRPAETRFLRAAREAGCKTANGLGMLLYQGAEALEIWSGKKAPLEVMRQALEEHLSGTKHV